MAYLAGAGSAAILLAAWAFQYIGGLAPCPICIWQRWPHAAAAVLALLLAIAPKPLQRPIMALGAVAAATTGAIGVYHTGIERGWWPGPDSCTGNGDALGGLTGTDLLDFSAPVNLVLCDEVAWSMFGLSMASWNALASFTLAALWVMALRRRG